MQVTKPRAGKSQVWASMAPSFCWAPLHSSAWDGSCFRQTAVPARATEPVQGAAGIAGSVWTGSLRPSTGVAVLRSSPTVTQAPVSWISESLYYSSKMAASENVSFRRKMVIIKATFSFLCLPQWTFLWNASADGAAPDEPVWQLRVPERGPVHRHLPWARLPLPCWLCWAEVREAHHGQLCWEGFLRGAAISQNSPSGKHLPPGTSRRTPVASPVLF